MARILNATNTADASAYAQIADLAGITATPAQIDGNTWFLTAEDDIIALFPSIDFSTRSYDNRASIVRALIFLTAYYFLSGGGTIASGRTSTEGSGDLKSKSVTIDGATVREDFDVGSSSSASNVVDITDRADKCLEQANRILARLGVSLEAVVDSDDPIVLLG